MMKNIFNFLFCVLLVVACQDIGKKQAANQYVSGKDSAVNASIYVENALLYDSNFIKNLKNYSNKIKIMNNYIINENDTIYFPEELPLNKEIVLSATQNVFLLKLILKRVDFTSILYTFFYYKNSESIYEKTGKAVLHPMFFLSPEIDEDTETGETYASSEYHDLTSDCPFSIRVGIGKDENKKLRATVHSICNSEYFPLKENLTLREK